jgi:hypothetical protein
VYRKKLTNSSDNLSPETLRDLERELGLTARAVGEKAMKARGVVDETAMVNLLSQYSERLLEMLDEKFAATLAKQLNLKGGNNEDSDSSGSGPRDTTPDRRSSAGDEIRHDSIVEEVE